MSREPENAARWVGSILKENSIATDVECIGPRLMRVHRRTLTPFVVGVVSLPRVTARVVQPFVDEGEADILINIPKESYWTADAVHLLIESPIAFGGIGDLMSAAGDDDVKGYVRAEYQFIERALGQHDKVSTLDRKNERVYTAKRNGMKSISFVLINEYELTGDHVRTARERHGVFDAVLLNNPNGNATRCAEGVAASMGVRIFNFGPFMGRLNSR